MVSERSFKRAYSRRLGIGDRPSLGEAESKKKEVEREIKYGRHGCCKSFFSEIRTNAADAEAGGSIEAIKLAMNIVITGASGTGKSTPKDQLRVTCTLIHSPARRNCREEYPAAESPYTGQTVHL